MTDMDHYGLIQWWRYPDDGAGACHSYALLKRRLLMTIVHESNGDGHAVLTVKTDRGEFILDNLTDDILLWSNTVPLLQTAIAGRLKCVGLAR
jgi:predicted transglutaminase-like cysteine proteinase